MTQDEAQTNPRERLWEMLCAVSQYVFILFILSAILLILSLISLFLTEPGTGSRVILYVDLALLGPFTACMFYILYRCR